MKLKVCFARLCINGTHRHEVGSALAAATLLMAGDPRMEPPHCITNEQFPTDAARNAVVAKARAARCDILFSVDDDMAPNVHFFKAALDFLLSQPEPSVIGSPYVTAPPEEKVLVYNYLTDETDGAGGGVAGFRVDHVAREDALRRTGIQRVANVGTGYIAYHMGVFDRFEQHYGHKIFYAHTFNEDHTAIIESEDCYNGRHLIMAGVPIYCHWDHWSMHCKVKKCGKPAQLMDEQVREIFARDARAELAAQGWKSPQQMALEAADSNGDNLVGGFGATWGKQ